MNTIWWKWYRHVDGEVIHDAGFQFVNESGTYFDEDYWYFDIEPEDLIGKRHDEVDSTVIHVDDLYDNYKEAVNWCQIQSVILKNKMNDLGVA